jgi:hypothetical protein
METAVDLLLRGGTVVDGSGSVGKQYSRSAENENENENKN